MQTREIPQDEWRSFFDDLNDQYRGWQVDIEVMRQDLGDQHLVRDMPLQGIDFETQGTEKCDIFVGGGDSPQSFQSHHVDRPQHVRIVDTRPGQQTDLEIESADGTRTLIHLHRGDELPA